MTICRCIVSEVRQFRWIAQAFSDRASASAERVTCTKPIYDPMNAVNLVWNRAGYVWLWEWAQIYQYSAVRWSDFFWSASVTNAAGMYITFTVNNMTDSRPNLRPNVSYCRVYRDHGRSGQFDSEMVRKLDMYVSIGIQEKAIAPWCKLDTLKDKSYRDLSMEMHIAQTKAA